MTDKPTPHIKGMFVKSHIEAVRKAKGEEGLKKLKTSFGKSLVYKNLDNVPVRDEIKLIECALEIISDGKVEPEKLAYEAGRLHFENFSHTPLAKFVLPFSKNNFKRVLLGARHLAGHVFRGVEFSTEDLGKKTISLTMANADYPLDHFRGLFQAWMEHSNLKGQVTATQLAPKTYKYVLKWV